MLTTLLSLLGAQQIAFSTMVPVQKPRFDLPAHPYPILKPFAIKPIIKAKAAFSIDLETGQILFNQNSAAKLPMASLTKLMTAWIVLHEHKLNEIVQIDPQVPKIEPSKANLLAYEKITVKALIEAIFVKSANDAALALAIYDSGSETKFAEKMNKYAQQMGLLDTHYENSTGLDADNHYSSARDIALLARKIYHYKIVQNSADLKSIVITSIHNKFKHPLKNTNKLLNSYLKVLGLKTGTTDAAGQCLVSIVEQNGHRILNVVLNSPARFKESKLLSQWIFDNYYWN